MLCKCIYIVTACLSYYNFLTINDEDSLGQSERIVSGLDIIKSVSATVDAVDGEHTAFA